MDARLREGIRLFNAGRFFESHESLEDFYSRSEEEHRPFVEGLIQLAAALRLFRDFGEVRGPVRMVHQAIIRLENYQPHMHVRGKAMSMEAISPDGPVEMLTYVDRFDFNWRVRFSIADGGVVDHEEFSLGGSAQRDPYSQCSMIDRNILDSLATDILTTAL